MSTTKRLALAICLVLMLGPIAQAQAPTANDNPNGVSFVTVCGWDVGCITYKVLKGIWEVWK